MNEPLGEDGPEQGGRNKLLIGGGVALLVAVAVGVFAAGGSGSDLKWSKEQSPAVAAEVAPTRTQPPKAAKLESAVRGIVKSKQEATIASRMTARIVAMPYGEGDSFPKGALLARFDCSQIQAQLNAAHAATAAYRKTYETNVELDQYEAVGKNEVAVSQANLGKADAEAKAVAAQLSDCAVYAPFSGKVVEEIAHSREVAASGQPLLKIQSGGNLEIELIVPSRWLTWLRPGAAFGFTIDETGQDIQGVVTRLGASVDAVSKTIRVTGDITETTGLVLPGMSGTASFPDAAKANAVTVPAATSNGKSS
ncbi:efflux RND transporter periplasmic adaptor subunit [Sphingopyxis sp.]|uniref:efflux RND transporter periplasmic adaptor subunit n=1 Tax=Sphingopyxis sp. TaxID=1908224 RepID=UPI003D0BD9D3